MMPNFKHVQKIEGRVIKWSLGLLPNNFGYLENGCRLLEPSLVVACKIATLAHPFRVKKPILMRARMSLCLSTSLAVAETAHTLSIMLPILVWAAGVLHGNLGFQSH